MKPIIASGKNIRTRILAPTFMDADTSVIGDDCMAIYSEKEEVPKQSVKIKMDKEIKSVFHNENILK